MTVLTVTNSFFPIGPYGTGAEQVAAMLDRAIVARGWNSVVIAAEGSETTGRLLATLPTDPDTINGTNEQFENVHNRLLEFAKAADFIHYHGLGFYNCLPEEKSRVLITLHAPIAYYPDELFGIPHIHFNAVSRYQARSLTNIRDLQIIENGVDISRYRPRFGKRRQLVFIRRICPEKGPHIALRVAHALGLPLTVAGPLHRYHRNQMYFERDVAPLLDEERQYIGPMGVEEKVALLATARCALMPGFWPETSSLVAMEAISCGVPIVAFPAGALLEVVEDGVTGFLVNSEDAMAKAVMFAKDLSPADCRARAELRFDSRRMAREYCRWYLRMLLEGLG